MAKEASVSEAGRFLPDAETAAGEEAAMLANKLTAVFLFILLLALRHPMSRPCLGIVAWCVMRLSQIPQGKLQIP